MKLEMVEKHTGTHIKALKLDNGEEYTSKEFMFFVRKQE
jgi:hypothetical protein